MTEEHIHTWTQFSPWEKTAFDRWSRSRDCLDPSCGEVEWEHTNNPRVAGVQAVVDLGSDEPGDEEEEVSRPVRPRIINTPVQQPQTTTVPEVKPFKSTIDPYVENVRTKLLMRSMMGQEKYGTTLARGDLSHLEWLNHAQEEAMDLCNYLERCIQDEERRLATQAELPIQMPDTDIDLSETRVTRRKPKPEPEEPATAP